MKILQTVFRLAVFQSGYAVLAFELHEEVGVFAKTRSVSDFGCGKRGRAQQFFGEAHTLIVEIGDHGFSRLRLEKPTKTGMGNM